MTNEIRAALKQICEVLNKHGTNYMLVGGVAVGFHGYSRISHGFIPGSGELEHDIDLWYQPTLENYLKIIKALDEFGIDTQELSDRVYDPQKSFMRIPFPNFKVEFIPRMIGVDSFLACKQRAAQISLDENMLFVIGREDLMKNKQQVGREIDKIDVEELKRKNP